MALKYVSISDINTALGTSGEDAYLTTVGESAEAIFDGLINGSLVSAEATEKYKFPARPHEGFVSHGREFVLNRKNPTSVATVAGTAVTSADYYLEGRKLVLKDAVSYPTTFPHMVEIKYTAGYTTIPSDVKAAILSLTGAMYTANKSKGVTSFTQDALTVSYGGETGVASVLDPASNSVFSKTVGRYKVPMAAVFSGTSNIDPFGVYP